MDLHWLVSDQVVGVILLGKSRGRDCARFGDQHATTLDRTWIFHFSLMLGDGALFRHRNGDRHSVFGRLFGDSHGLIDTRIMPRNAGQGYKFKVQE